MLRDGRTTEKRVSIGPLLDLTPVWVWPTYEYQGGVCQKGGQHRRPAFIGEAVEHASQIIPDLICGQFEATALIKLVAEFNHFVGCEGQQIQHATSNKQEKSRVPP